MGGSEKVDKKEWKRIKRAGLIGGLSIEGVWFKPLAHYELIAPYPPSINQITWNIMSNCFRCQIVLGVGYILVPSPFLLPILCKRSQNNFTSQYPIDCLRKRFIGTDSPYFTRTYLPSSFSFKKNSQNVA